MPIRPENRDRYPKNWKEISAHVRFDRAGSLCECRGECGAHDGWCGAMHGKPHHDTGSTVVLTTAHLDHQPENCDLDNLRAMCQCCHLNYDSEHHAETRYMSRRCSGTEEMFGDPSDKKGEPNANSELHNER